MSGAEREPDRPPREETERERRNANLVLLLGAAVLIGAGVWLVDGMIAARKADDCMSSGRRNCGPIEMPQMPQR